MLIIKGYEIRFDHKVSEHTHITFMTEGVLIREILRDRRLTTFDFVIIDEAHERGFNLALLLGFKKFLSKQKIIIMTAPLEIDNHATFFAESEANSSKKNSKKRKRKVVTVDQVCVQGRYYPIEILNTLEPVLDYTQSAKDMILQIHFNEPLPGDILVFLTGMEEIENLKTELLELIQDNPKEFRKLPLEILPLYSLLAPERQQKVFENFGNKRKVILSTNIAETSVTFDGVKYVVDSGFVKIKYFNNQNSVESLGIIPISKASAKQRAGRAGRSKPGKCIRLYPEDAYSQLDDFGIPEILRTDLLSLVLQLKGLGVNNIFSFDFIDPPGKEILLDCLNSLTQLGAVAGEKHTLTPKGRRLLEFPLDPVSAACLINLVNVETSDAYDVITIIALKAGENIYASQSLESSQRKYLLSKFGVSGSDHLTQLNVFYGFVRARNVKEFCKVFGINRRGIENVILVRHQLLEIFERVKKSEEGAFGFGGESDFFNCKESIWGKGAIL